MSPRARDSREGTVRVMELIAIAAEEEGREGFLELKSKAERNCQRFLLTHFISKKCLFPTPKPQGSAAGARLRSNGRIALRGIVM